MKNVALGGFEGDQDHGSEHIIYGAGAGRGGSGRTRGWCGCGGVFAAALLWGGRLLAACNRGKKDHHSTIRDMMVASSHVLSLIPDGSNYGKYPMGI
jgi:hypothetical protein